MTLPDGQDVLAYLHERRQWPRGGWMYLAGIPVWANDHAEGIEAREYRVWLTPGEQVHAIDGVSYDHVPTHALPPEESAPDPNRFAPDLFRSRSWSSSRPRSGPPAPTPAAPRVPSGRHDRTNLAEHGPR